MLTLARRLWRRNLAELQPQIRQSIPIVVVEPACASAFRDELPNLFPRDRDAHRLASQTWLLSELLVREGWEPPKMAGKAAVHGHCHHRSVLASTRRSTCCGTWAWTLRCWTTPAAAWPATSASGRRAKRSR